MIAFALDFNADADSHLVCEQDATGSYRTQVFTTGVTARKGISFVFILPMLINKLMYRYDVSLAC